MILKNPTSFAPGFLVRCKLTAQFQHRKQQLSRFSSHIEMLRGSFILQFSQRNVEGLFQEMMYAVETNLVTCGLIKGINKEIVGIMSSSRKAPNLESPAIETLAQSFEKISATTPAGANELHNSSTEKQQRSRCGTEYD